MRTGAAVQAVQEQGSTRGGRRKLLLKRMVPPLSHFIKPITAAEESISLL